MGRTAIAYILGSSKPLSFFKTENDPRYSDIFEKLGAHFPDLPVPALREYTQEMGSPETHQNLIVGMDRAHVHCVSYDEARSINWNWQPLTRGRQDQFFRGLLTGKLRLDYKVKENIEQREAHPRSPFLFLVDLGNLSKKGRPTPRQVEACVRHYAELLGKRVETEIMYEGPRSQFPRFRRKEHGLPFSGTLECLAEAHVNRIDTLVRELGEKYASRAYRPGFSSENLKKPTD